MRTKKAFTLIELLVVVSIIALLISILLPSLQRVHKQAMSIGCQANLRQWGILYATYTSQNNGYLPPLLDSVPTDWAASNWMGSSGIPHARLCIAEGGSFAAFKGIFCCPSAAKPGYPILFPAPKGGTFLAWTVGWSAGPSSLAGWYSSYAANHQAHSWWGDRSDPSIGPKLRFTWMTSAVKNAAAVPVFLDSMWAEVILYDDKSPPPQCDAIPTRTLEDPTRVDAYSVCINRHEGGINSLFMDWSVRKAGLKELWTLKWWSEYNTQGPWTKAGGVKPEDWPLWMRRFKDY
ncbi:MAG: prepilin-type N-terminal cleavage/methylation domain-containing protein [Sedimentisphaerales bacterium]|nr:prepilin-type N-terminal cleavage/methylation domain-containing protein [Sedimentisphaerales bacterium]